MPRIPKFQKPMWQVRVKPRYWLDDPDYQDSDWLFKDMIRAKDAANAIRRDQRRRSFYRDAIWEASQVQGPLAPMDLIRNARRRELYAANKEKARKRAEERAELEAWRAGGYLSERQPIPRNAYVYVPLFNRKAVDIWGKDPDTGFITGDPRPYEDYADYFWQVDPKDPNYKFAREIGIGLPDMYKWDQRVLRPDSRDPDEFSGQTPYEVWHDTDYGWSDMTPADLGYKRWKTWKKFEPERYCNSLEDY